MASGWMQVRQRARQRGVELPLVISEHADWASCWRRPSRWVLATHDREEALAHALEDLGIKARPLTLVGFDEEGQ
jgi:putative mRNA 3-end processing factor